MRARRPRGHCSYALSYHKFGPRCGAHAAATGKRAPPSSHSALAQCSPRARASPWPHRVRGRGPAGLRRASLIRFSERPPSSMKYDPSRRVLSVAVTLHHVPEKHISCDVEPTRIKVDTTACKQHPYLLECVLIRAAKCLSPHQPLSQSLRRCFLTVTALSTRAVSWSSLMASKLRLSAPQLNHLINR